MKISVVILFSIALFFATINCTLRDLDPSNFDDYVDGTTPAFVEFYAPWCGHCKNLAPEYDLVAEGFKRYTNDVTIGRVDCDAHSELCQRFGVQGYPTLKFFTEGDVTEGEAYNGGRTADAIISYINGKVGTKAFVPKGAPSDVVDLSDNTFDSVVLDDSKHVFVEFYAPWCGHCKNLAPTYESFGTVFATEEDVVIARIDADSQRESGTKYDVNGFPTLKWFPKDDKSGIDYQGGRDLQDLVDFVNEHAGTQRNSDGSLQATVGLIDDFSDLVESFKADGASSALAEQAEAIATKIGTKMAKVYKVIFGRSVDNSEYIATEISRLTRMIESGNLNRQKIDEFTMRINILNSFQ